MATTRLEIPIQKSLVPPSLEFIDVWAEGESLSPYVRASLKASAGGILESILRLSQGPSGSVRIELERKKEEVLVHIVNSGLPLYVSDLPLVMRDRESFKRVEFQNCGRAGQKLTFAIEAQRDEAVAAEEEKAKGEDVRIRRLTPEEAPRLSRLFYKVYRYRYINEYVYYPEKLAEMMTDGRLTAVVAEMPNGDLAGHVGLLRWNDDPVVFEAALGIVDPSYKSSGFFSRIFKEVMDIKHGFAHQYCIYDFVTNHEYSQRMVAKYTYHDVALYLGSQVSETQARLSELGIGQDPEDMDRYSLLVGLGKGVDNPFGKEIVLPTQIGVATEFLLKPLGLEWVPAPRFYPLGRGGAYQMTLQPEQQAANFDFHEPGLAAAHSILARAKQLLRDKVQYISVDVPLKYPGLGQLYDILASGGFFMSGYVPYKFSGELAFRFQFLAPTKVSFENIKMFSPSGQRLLEMVRADYERNTIL